MTSPPVRIKPGWLIDGRGGSARPETGVVVQHGRISVVAPNDLLPEIAGAIDLAYPGDTLLPGLFDAHVHLAFDGSEDPVQSFLSASPDEVESNALNAATEALHSGVTSVRDCGGPGDLIHRVKDAITEMKKPGLRVLSCGRPLTSERGHCWFFGGEAADGEQLEELTRYEVSRGADHIKIMASGGGITPGSDPTRVQFSEEDISRAATAAHASSRIVGCHALATEAIANAVQAGADALEHCSFLTSSGPRYDPRVAELIAVHGCRVVPTLATVYHPLTTGELIGNLRGMPMTPREYFDMRVEVVRKLRALGITLLAGSDAGDHIPPDSVIMEIAMLVHVGLTPEEAVGAGSLEPARLLGLDHEIGSVSEGAIADLLLVQGNVSEDIRSLYRTRCVIKDGHIVTGPHVTTRRAPVLAV
jgi:imidazolonepropionase-like amidohydrolase